MHNTVQHGTAWAWNEVKAHHLVAGAAVLVIVAAVMGVAVLQTLAGGSETPVAVRLQPSTPREPLTTYYIVGSQEQADAVALAENDSAQIQAFYGDYSFLQTQIVVATDEEQTVTALTEANNIRHAAGAAEIRIVDLRQPAEEAEGVRY